MKFKQERYAVDEDDATDDGTCNKNPLAEGQAHSRPQREIGLQPNSSSNCASSRGVAPGYGEFGRWPKAARWRRRCPALALLRVPLSTSDSSSTVRTAGRLYIMTTPPTCRKQVTASESSNTAILFGFARRVVQNSRLTTSVHMLLYAYATGLSATRRTGSLKHRLPACCCGWWPQSRASAAGRSDARATLRDIRRLSRKSRDILRHSAPSGGPGVSVSRYTSGKS